MRKKTVMIVIAALAMILVFAGCNRGPVLSFNIAEDGKSLDATFDKAKKGDYAMAGTLIVEDGDVIRIDSALEGNGKATFSLISADGDVATDENASVEELAGISDADPTVEVSVSGSDSVECTVPSGDYYVKVTADKKATGTVNLVVEGSEGSGTTQMPNPWSDVATGAEAAQGAGVDTYEVPEGAEISLGAIKVEAYRYMDGIAEAYIPFPAVDTTIRKGIYAGDGDISGDYNEYAHMWTDNINGMDVSCYGNREGESTKTVAISGDYAYTITAYGMGGDTDYGLSADDLNTILSGLK